MERVSSACSYWVPAFAGTSGGREVPSPDRVKRNPGQASPLIPDFANAQSGRLAARDPSSFEARLSAGTSEDG